MLAPDESNIIVNMQAFLKVLATLKGFYINVQKYYTVLYRFNVNYTYFIHTLIYTVDGT